MNRSPHPECSGRWGTPQAAPAGNGTQGEGDL
ncbi:hypothetical protein J2X26_004230 [Cellulomonas humilata]|uniref:Uncharacterized protein n=1 Tax=Cellulomonas humilata TaxID=144055 RepID=A0ABU0EL09_9CELL|nr:hypothetical protein [Cellulomonas humilata]